MAEALNVKARENTGTQNNRRLRKQGNIPAVLYGHGEKNINLTATMDDMLAVLRHHGRVVELKGAVNEKALIKDLQWDVYGIDIVHVDFTRVSEHEHVTVQIPVELRGDAPGVKEGGILELVIHELEVDCEAEAIPEKIEIVVKDLHLGGEITAGEIPLPTGVKLVTEAESLVVHCVKPKAMDLGAEGAVAEPEVIGRKPGEESEDEEK